MNQDKIIFKSQFILESLAKKDPVFNFNLAHDSDNKVTSIIWMTFYMRDNFERFGDYISINVMYSSICNAKIAPVMINEVGKINVVCEDLCFGFIVQDMST